MRSIFKETPMLRPLWCIVLVMMAAPLFADEIQRPLRLTISQDNPRNSEGAFVRLTDGRILLVYTRFTAGKGGDHDPSVLAGRFSADGGATWTDQDVTILPNEGAMNTMSVSLLRMADGRIALFYLRKNSTQDCRPYVRFSADEAATWSAPVQIVPDAAVDYYVLNNDRVIQLSTGRLILPLARHANPSPTKFVSNAVMTCYLSDDAGKTWRVGKGTVADPKITLQEPGVVELKDRRVMMFIRTSGGAQFISHSSDGGDAWSPAKPSPDLLGPISPASIKRIPDTGDLLVLWNNHQGMDRKHPLYTKRTPFTAAISRDDGATWQHVKNVDDNPNGWYCYTAILFADGHVLLANCAGDKTKTGGLAETQITRIPVGWFYR